MHAIELSEEVGTMLEARIEAATGPEPHTDVVKLLNEARGYLPPPLFFQLEAAINGERVAVTEASFAIGYEAARKPAAWIFGSGLQ